MAPFDVDSMLQKLKQVYVDRVVATGFEDVSIYNDELLKLNDIDLEAFKKLKKIIGETKASPKTNEIDINNQGFTDEEYEAVEKAKKKKKEELTEEEKALLEAAKEKKKARDTAISILRGISIRIPLLIYGANIPYGQDLTIDNFTDENIIDDKSWEEFMPKGVTKEIFNDFKKYYDQDIFIAAGNKIRRLAKIADEYGPTERIKRIADIFSTFRNPDKETVLTPWRVVNMHMSDTLGGYDFYDEDHKTMIAEPRFVNQGQVTSDVFNAQTRILEINSKTGLYPLYVAYSTFRAKCEAIKASGVQALTMEQEQEIWFKTVAENIFVVCKTTMAKYITHRTLVGYTGKKTNLHAFEDLQNQVQNNKESLIKNITRPGFWNIKHQTQMLKFNAIVGNPPYQSMDNGAGASAGNIFQLFIEAAIALHPQYVSMVTPSRWYRGGKNLDKFRATMLKTKSMKKIFDYWDSFDLFTSLGHNAIKGGVNYFLYEVGSDQKCEVNTCIGAQCVSSQERYLNELDLDIFVRYNGEALTILDKILPKPQHGEHRYKLLQNQSMSQMVSARKPFGLPTNFSNFAKSSAGNVEIYANKQIAYVKRSQITVNSDWIDKWKVLIPEAIGVGDPASDWLKPIIVGKNTCCTETYLVIGPFDTKEEAENMVSYMQTKFFHFFLALRKISQHTTQDVYSFIPLQDFHESWNDEKLAKKYNLSQAEIEYINKMICPNK